MTIVNKLLYIDSYYLASVVIFSNVFKKVVLKQLFGKKLFQNNFSPRIIKQKISNPRYIYVSQKTTAAQNEYALSYHRVRGQLLL